MVGKDGSASLSDVDNVVTLRYPAVEGSYDWELIANSGRLRKAGFFKWNEYGDVQAFKECLPFGGRKKVPILLKIEEEPAGTVDDVRMARLLDVQSEHNSRFE
jgi:hypothetical protein